MSGVESRVRERFPGAAVVVWQGDPATFQFTYVSTSASELLGYPVDRWTRETNFWTECVVVPEDKSEAVAYCALATAGRRDHVFEYRARTAEGLTLVLRDLVRVVLGPKGIPVELRGLMFDVTEQRSAQLSLEQLRDAQYPSRAELELLAG
jgi:PAS domain-containing protein